MVVTYLVGMLVSHIPYGDKVAPGLAANTKNGVVERETADTNTLPALRTTLMLTLLPSPRQRIHNRIMDRRLATPPTSVDEEETVRDTDSVAAKHVMMQQYLDEQNAKFDHLINRNLGEVLQQQHTFQEDRGWRDAVFAFVALRLHGGVVASMTSMVQHASKAVSHYARGRRDSTTLPTAVEASTERDIVVLPAAVVAAVELLEYRDKVAVLRRLHEDLGVEDVRIAPEHALLMDKVQTMTLLLVRLAFIALRLVVPVTTALYTRFKNDDIVLVNRRNLDRLLGSVIHVMESMEETLRTRPDADILDHVAFDPPIGGDSWAATVARHALLRGTKADFARDPRYAHYFTRHLSDSDDEMFADAEDGPSVLQVAQQFANEMS